MKKYCFALFGLLLAGSVEAQNYRSIPYHEGFEEGLSGWQVVDGDGDGLNWRVVDFSAVPPAFEYLGYFAQEGTHVLYSESAADLGSTQSPSNWAVSPIFEMPAELSDSLTLTWWVKAFAPASGGDHYEVRIGVVTDTVVDTADYYLVLPQ